MINQVVGKNVVLKWINERMLWLQQQNLDGIRLRLVGYIFPVTSNNSCHTVQKVQGFLRARTVFQIRGTNFGDSPMRNSGSLLEVRTCTWQMRNCVLFLYRVLPSG